MASLVWNVTRSMLSENSARNWWNVPPEQRPAKLPMMFRLYDDDGELYYEGRATCEHAVLDCLDTLGEAAGCTTAKVKSAGKWQFLN